MSASTRSKHRASPLSASASASALPQSVSALPPSKRRKSSASAEPGALEGAIGEEEHYRCK
jgi:hypothetical protein